MYIGRIVAVGMSRAGKTAAMYRVSSRSFPNREARKTNGTVSIMPREGFEGDLNKSPYIAYNCVKIAGNYAVATNGSHTDPVAEKIMSGMSVRDSLALSLTTMDYEKDDYNTPRIAAVTHLENSTAFLATIRKDALIVREFKLEPGTAFFVATYGKDTPEEANTDRNFDIAGPLDGCRHILGRGVFSDFEKPVTAACVFSGENGFELAVKTV